MERKRGWGYRKGVRWSERVAGGIEKVWDGEKERIGE